MRAMALRRPGTCRLAVPTCRQIQLRYDDHLPPSSVGAAEFCHGRTYGAAHMCNEHQLPELVDLLCCPYVRSMRLCQNQ
jgi:hypothetical protein